MTPKISVIIPVYNLQEYLANVLDNLIDHQFANMDKTLWEIIIVNDGSTDSTHDIAEFYYHKYSENINYIETKNQGVSSARNLGIEKVHGKYIYFIDGDDLLTENALSRLLDIAEKVDADILHFEFSDISTQEYNHYKEHLPFIALDEQKNEIIDATDFMSATECMTRPRCQWAIWQKLFRKDFIVKNNIEFSVNVPIGEDAIFNIRTMLKKPIFVKIDAPLYLYHNRPDSVIRSELTNVSPNQFEKIITGRELYLLKLRDIRKVLIEANFDEPTIHGLDAEMTHIFYDYMLRLLLNGAPELGAMKNNSLTYGKRIFPNNFGRLNEFLARAGFSESNLKSMRAELIPTFYAALADIIANGAGFHEIYSTLRQYKSQGGHIKFGKPRFRNSRHSRASVVRRWIAAYIFALILKL